MKVTIAFLDSEEQTAGTIERFICGLLQKVRVRRTDTHEPYRHIYITSIMVGGKRKPDGAP